MDEYNQSSLSSLGTAYYEAGDFHKAIEYHELALERAKTQGDKQHFGAHLGNIGRAYIALHEYETAMMYCKQALQFFKEIGDEEGVGSTMCNIGCIYADLKDYSKAIEYYEVALTILGPILGDDHSITQGLRDNIAIAQRLSSKKLTGNSIFKIAADVMRKWRKSGTGLESDLAKASPIQKELALKLLREPSDPREETRRLQLFDEAFDLIDRSELPNLWAALKHDFGNALSATLLGNRAENQKLAIIAFNEALEIRTRNKYPLDWALTKVCLAVTLEDQLGGDLVDNQEQAIEIYEDVLTVFTERKSPREWAGTKNNLGNVYAERISGNRTENLEAAIAAYTAALKYWTFEYNPKEWGDAQHNIGTTFHDRIQGDREQNIEKAIYHLETSLRARTIDSFPVQWANTQNDLGLVYSDRIKGNAEENLEIAIEAFNKALSIRTRTEFPIQWSESQLNLGNALRRRIKGNHVENVEGAIEAYRAAMETAQSHKLYEFERKAAENLGDTYYESSHWQNAYDSYKVAIEAIDKLHLMSYRKEMKLHLGEKNARLYSRAVESGLKLGREVESFELADSSKGRFFVDQLGYGAFPRPSVPEDKKYLLEKEASLINEIRKLNVLSHRTRNDLTPNAFNDELGAKSAELTSVWNELKAIDEEYIRLRKGDHLEYNNLQKMLNESNCDVALIEFLTLQDKILTFLVRRGEEKPTVAETFISRNDLLYAMKLLQDDGIYLGEIPELDHRSTLSQWQDIGDKLFDQVLHLLDGASLLCIVPHGLLHYLPIHAFRIRDQSLIDLFPVVYAPNAASLERILKRNIQDRQGCKVCSYVAGNPTLNLKWAAQEAKTVAEILNVKPYLGRNASKKVTLSEFEKNEFIHLACHGKLEPNEPLQSHVLLAGGEKLDALEIMGLNLSANLVTLSACETGLSEVNLGDELFGLTRACLYAGASSILVSLWAVDDKSTASLMKHFYSRLFEGGKRTQKSKAVALNEAMLAIRKEYKSPYHWAPFFLVGGWN